MTSFSLPEIHDKESCCLLHVYVRTSISKLDFFLDKKLKLKLSYDRRSVGQSILVSGSHLEPMTRFFFFSVRQLRVSWHGTPSLTRWWVCNLLAQLLLGLARAVTLGCKSRRFTTIFYCLIWDSSNLEGQISVFIFPQEQGGSVIPPGTGFPFRRLLRLAGLRWRYSNPPPHGPHWTFLAFFWTL
jgi:hypothetical protein